MRSFRTFLYALAVVALAACGGGGSAGALPPAAVSDPGTRDPSGSTVAFEKRTLWVSYGQAINTFSTDVGGPVTPLKRSGPFPWYNAQGVPIPALPGVVDLAIAPDGTRWLLESRDEFLGGSGWRLYAVAAHDNLPENTYGDDINRPFAFVLGGDGVMIGYSGASGTTIVEYPYAASSKVPPLRTLNLTGSVRGFAAGNDGRYYVLRPNSIGVYLPVAAGWSLVRSIATATRPGVTIDSQAFAVGPDSSVYAVELPGNLNNPVMYVDVYARGSGTIARRIGPLPANYNGLGFPVITVDALNRLYVATQGSIYRFGPQANGTAKPQLVMTDATIGRPSALAVGPKL